MTSRPQPFKLASHFLTQLRDQLPSDFLSVDPEHLKSYGRDWTQVVAPNPSAIAFPRSTDEVSRFLALCSQHKVPVVPSGGRTGLAGGAVAGSGEVVLSMTRMNALGEVNELAHTLHVQAGVVTETVHQHCAKHHLAWPVDFASKGSSQVGGNISTNAGGVKVIRFGPTRNWTLGLQVVQMDGTILNLNGSLEKNNTGLDLRHLMIGSEGILGVVTEATLKLCQIPKELDVFFFALDSIASVLNLFGAVRKTPFQISAFEFLTRNCLEAVHEIMGITPPFEKNHAHKAFVLLEIERPQTSNAQEQLDHWLGELFEKGLVLDGTLAQSPREGRELWKLRENITESLSRTGFVYKNDIALPISELKDFVSTFETSSTRFENFVFGHIGDGNLHVNTMKPKEMAPEEFLSQMKSVNLALYELIKTHQGSISAEHGIGLLKKSSLHFTRSEAEIQLMRQLKKAFDPLNLLNPGKVIDL